MAKWILYIFALLLTGCTNHLLVNDSRENHGDYQTVAKNIYQTAKKCWAQQETLIKAQILVESVVTLDAIIVYARFDSFGSGVQNPFIKFIIKPDGDNNTKIDLYTQEIEWMGNKQHLQDAYNWMSGNYVCSQQPLRTGGLCP